MTLGAWYAAAIAVDPVTQGGAPYHRACWERRRAVLRPSPEVFPDFMI